MKHLLHYNCVALTPIWIRKPHLAWWRLQIGIMQLVAFRCKGNVPEWPHQNMCGSFYQKMQRRERTASSQPLCYYYPLEIDDVPVLHGCFANVGREIIWGDCCGSLVMSMPLSEGWIEKKKSCRQEKRYLAQQLSPTSLWSNFKGGLLEILQYFIMPRISSPNIV